MSDQDMAQDKTEPPESSPFILVGDHDDSTIKIKNLTVKTPGEQGRTLTRNVNLTLEKGKRYVFTGESGSGKTITAKAILNLWDDGSGLIKLPSGIKIMSMPQQAYFSDTDLRGILNMGTPDTYQFSDQELVEALQKVDLDNLIQFIPGQQYRLMFEQMAADLPQIADEILGDNISLTQMRALKYKVMAAAVEYMADHFDTMQYIPEAQREQFSQDAKTALAKHLPPSAVDIFVKDVLEEIEKEAAFPLLNAIARTIPERARNSNGFFYPLWPNRKSVLASMLERKLNNRFTDYLNNDDTDDKFRTAGMSQEQATYLAEKVGRMMREELPKHTSFTLGRIFNGLVMSPLNWAFNNAAGNAVKDSLRNSFNAAAPVTRPITNAVSLVAKGLYKIAYPVRLAADLAMWPTNAFYLNWKAGSNAKEIAHATTLFLEQQKLRGSNLTYGSRLSGGQKQKLMMAIALLHRPDILIPDEITAALDRKTGEKLYRELMESLPKDTTVISIAHNEHIRQFHTHHLHLENQTITMTEIPEEERYTAGATKTPKPKGP